MRKLRFVLILSVLGVLAVFGVIAAQEGDVEPAVDSEPHQIQQLMINEPYAYPASAYEEPGGELEPVETDALVVLSDGLRLGSPERVGEAWVFPLFLKDPGGADYYTLAGAVEEGVLGINELESAEVNTVELVWETKRPLFILAGQMIQGAKQDRVFSRDVLLEDRGRGPLPVYCVESGRWSGGPTVFTAGKMVVGNEVRGAVNLQADQGYVWAKVSEVQDSVGQYSDTSAYRVVLESEEVDAVIEKLGDVFGDFAEEGACGVLLFGGGYVLGLDLFDNAGLFGELSDELTVAYSTQVAVLEEGTGHPEPGKLMKEFVDGLGGLATFAYPGESVGAGEFVVVNDRGVSGGFLDDGGRVVHLMLTQTPPEGAE
ncbi:hypothetical protein KAU45_00980 [bacterium]|nr:hypothetical protein [bacterium]